MYAYLRSRIFQQNKKRRRMLVKRDCELSSATHIVKELLNDMIDNVICLSEIRDIVDEMTNEVARGAVTHDTMDAIAPVIQDTVAKYTKGAEGVSDVNIYEMEINMENKRNMEDSCNMEDSWSIAYDIDNVKIYHCHIPVISNESDYDSEDKDM